MVDPGEDFGGYMENMAAMEEDYEREQEMLAKHEHWRQTTWGGFAVRQIQALGRHFGPFFSQVAEMMGDNQSIGSRLILFFVRLLVIFVGLALLYGIGQWFTYVVGREIVQEEEIVVVHEYETEEEAAKARAEDAKKLKRRQKEE